MPQLSNGHATALRTEAWFRALMEQSPLSTQVFSPDGQTIEVNHAWERLWGAKIEDVADYNILQDPQLVVRGIMPYIQRGFAGEATAIPAVWYDPNETIPDRSVRPDPRRWVRAFIHPIKDAAGQITEVVLVHEDMTDQKLAEMALEESEQRFARFMQYLPGLAWSKDIEGRYVYANESALEAFSRSPEELYGRTDDQLFPPETATQFKRNDQLALSRENGIQVVERLEQPDGIVHHSLVTKFPIPGVNGQPALVGGMAIDITDVKHAEDKLRESEGRLRLALEAGRMGVWDWNLRTQHIWWTDNLESLHGMAPGSFTGDMQGFERIIHPEDRDFVRQAIQEALEQKTDYSVEFRILWHDGSIHWIAGNGRVFCDEQGQPERMAGVAMDVTDRKLAEDALRDADRRKDEFLATLAHELRNPLAPIRNGLQIFKMPDATTQTIADARAMMERQLGQMVRLIDDLLDVSRITRGKLELRSQAVAVSDVIHSAIETSQPLIDAAGHELLVTMPARPIHVWADPTRLSQVLSNVLNNSAKYMEKGGTICLTLRQEAGDVVIAIKDVGIGIAPAHLPYIFDMFSQADSASERSQGGLGIGLALVRGLIQMHGGTVEAHSEGIGRGSEFVVRLPMVEPAATTPEPQQPAHPTARSPQRRVLVVDDNVDGAVSLAVMLQTAGSNVELAYDGSQAIEVAEKFLPELILMDLGMPRLNGFDACRAIRQKPWGQDMLIIAVSGWGQEHDRRKSLSAGFNEHLVKPIEFQAVMQLLEQATPMSGGLT